MKHRLKTEPTMWDDINSFKKMAEFRKDDRGFNVGDDLELIRGYEDAVNCRVIERRVTHIVRGPAFGIPSGYAMLSLAIIFDDGFIVDKPAATAQKEATP